MRMKDWMRGLCDLGDSGKVALILGTQRMATAAEIEKTIKTR